MNRSVSTRFYNKISKQSSGCWLWLAAKSRIGYGAFQALGESKAHRVSFKLFNGEIPEGMSVLHKCDVRNCVNPEHLFLGTQKDNMQDCARKGRLNSRNVNGTKNPMAKLDDHKIKTLFFWKGKKPQAEIARMFRLSPMTISRLFNNKSYIK